MPSSNRRQGASSLGPDTSGGCPRSCAVGIGGQGKVASSFPGFWLPRNTQGNTLGSLLGRRGRWDTEPAPVHGLRSPGRGWLSRAGGGEAAARGRSRGAAPTGGCPAAPPWCDNLGSSSSSSSSPCRSYLRERSVSPASRTHDAHVVRWRSPPLPPPSRLSDAAASQLERGLPHAPKGGCETRRRSAWGRGAGQYDPGGCRVVLTCGIFQVWKLACLLPRALFMPPF